LLVCLLELGLAGGADGAGRSGRLGTPRARAAPGVQTSALFRTPARRNGARAYPSANACPLECTTRPVSSPTRVACALAHPSARALPAPASRQRREGPLVVNGVESGKTGVILSQWGASWGARRKTPVVQGHAIPLKFGAGGTGIEPATCGFGVLYRSFVFVYNCLPQWAISAVPLLSCLPSFADVRAYCRQICRQLSDDVWRHITSSF
jgi:hypothetical protein